MTEKLSQSDTLGQEVLPDHKNSKLPIDDQEVKYILGKKWLHKIFHEDLHDDVI